MYVPTVSAGRSSASAMFDPRSKLVLTVLAIVAVITLHSAIELGAAYAVIVLSILGIGTGRTYLRWLRILSVMVLVWFAIVWLTADTVTAITAALRLLGLTSVFFLFFAVTRPEELADALVQSGMPYSAGFVVRAALQFVPVVSHNTGAVYDAQRARGIPLDRGIRALRHYPALFAPLLVQSFRLADHLAEAMESRGFGRSGRTLRHSYRLRLRDWAVMLAAVGGLALLIVK